MIDPVIFSKIVLTIQELCQMSIQLRMFEVEWHEISDLHRFVLHTFEIIYLVSFLVEAHHRS